MGDGPEVGTNNSIQSCQWSISLRWVYGVWQVYGWTGQLQVEKREKGYRIVCMWPWLYYFEQEMSQSTSVARLGNLPLLLYLPGLADGSLHACLYVLEIMLFCYCYREVLFTGLGTNSGNSGKSGQAWLMLGAVKSAFQPLPKLAKYFHFFSFFISTIL